MRIKKNLTRIQVAILIKKSKTFIEGIETGKQEPKLSTAKELAEIYGTEIDDILFAYNEESEI